MGKQGSALKGPTCHHSKTKHRGGGLKVAWALGENGLTNFRVLCQRGRDPQELSLESKYRWAPAQTLSIYLASTADPALALPCRHAAEHHPPKAITTPPHPVDNLGQDQCPLQSNPCPGEAGAQPHLPARPQLSLSDAAACWAKGQPRSPMPPQQSQLTHNRTGPTAHTWDTPGVLRSGDEGGIILLGPTEPTYIRLLRSRPGDS